MKPNIDNEICILCGNVGLQYVHDVRDDKFRTIGKCIKCGHVQLTPIPTTEEDEAFYNSNNINGLFKDDADWQNIEWLEERYRPYAENQVSNFIKYIDESDSVIEVGSGYGHLVEILRNTRKGGGGNVEGIEIADKKRELFRKRTGSDLLNINLLTKIPDELSECFDIVCTFQTIEHIINPVKFVDRMTTMIKPGGRIYIEVPNENDFLKPACKAYENFTYCRAHLSYYTPKTLAFLLEKCGFSNVKILGYQVFSIENALWWIRNGEPFKEYHQIKSPSVLTFADDYYKRELEEQLISNCIIAIGVKP